MIVCPDDTKLPYQVSPHLPALLLMSNASDAVFHVELLLRTKLLYSQLSNIQNVRHRGQYWVHADASFGQPFHVCEKYETDERPTLK